MTDYRFSAYDMGGVKRPKLLGFRVSVTTYAAAQLIRVLPRVRLSRVVGRLCERPLPPRLSRVVAGAYARAYRVNMDEAHSDQPYQSFDAFFTRPLRAGVRSISSDRVVSPADGVLSAVGPIQPSSRIVVKHQPYSVAELIGDAVDARRYAKGEFAVVYLSPRHYHRVHSPVDGNLALVRAIPGDLYPVNSIGERYIPHLFVRNNRVAYVIDTETFGRVTLVMVGATIVGRISVTALGRTTPRPGVTRIEPGHALQRGEEIGIFHLGSTVVVLFEPGTTIQRARGEVLYGESLLQSS